MKVDYENRRYTVTWKHFTKEPQGQKRTICILKDLENGTKIEAMAKCDERDNFEKAIGRKLSLTRVLNRNIPDKNFRKEIWNRYMEEIGA